MTTCGAGSRWLQAVFRTHTAREPRTVGSSLRGTGGVVVDQVEVALSKTSTVSPRNRARRPIVRPAALSLGPLSLAIDQPPDVVSYTSTVSTGLPSTSPPAKRIRGPATATPTLRRGV